MKKRLPIFLAGLILGILLVPSAWAASQYICDIVEYPVYIDGVEYSSEKLPLLNYEGNTYAPMRSILETAGLVVVWDDATSSVIIKTNKSPAPDDPIINKTDDGITIYTINGTDYVKMAEACQKYTNYTFGASKSSTDKNPMMALKLASNKTEVISDMEYEIYDYSTYVTVEYYINTILPILSGN